MTRTYVPCGQQQYYEDPVGSLGFLTTQSACDYSGERRACKLDDLNVTSCPVTTAVIAPRTSTGDAFPAGTVVTVTHPVTGAPVAGVVSTDGSTAIIPPTDAVATQSPPGAVPGTVMPTATGPVLVTNTGVSVSTDVLMGALDQSRIWKIIKGFGIFFGILAFLNFIGYFPLIYRIFAREFGTADTITSGFVKFLKGLGNFLFALFLMPWFTWANMKK
jgi:hypothetical protein